jgi:hypothetical protein
MSTFLTIFNAFPAILASVQAVEGAIPMPNAGQQKLNLILSIAGTAWEVGQVGEQINKTNWLTAVQAMTNIAVAGLNAAGVFHNGTGAATSPGASAPAPTVPATPVSSN